MKFFAIIITETTLPLVTELNNGVVPAPESMNHVFMYPATKPDENISTIVTKEELKETYIVDSGVYIALVHVK
jgi:hypothetical protein